jgi:Surface antigen variable number repeat
MRLVLCLSAIAAYVLLPLTPQAQCVKDYRSNKSGGWLVRDFQITGTQNLSSDDLGTMASSLIGWCIDQDDDALRTVVEGAFQEHGYYGATIKELQAKVLDPTSQPIPIAMEANVVEGQRYKLAGVEFVGNRALSEAVLRKNFSIENGDLFQRSKLASGMDGIVEEYVRHGYLDCTFISDTEQSSNSTVLLKLKFTEGPQYRIGKLVIFAKSELAEKLRARWKIGEGAVYDGLYREDFVRANATLLPKGFTPGQIQAIRDCPKALVEVHVVVDPALASVESATKPVACNP